MYVVLPFICIRRTVLCYEDINVHICLRYLISDELINISRSVNYFPSLPRINLLTSRIDSARGAAAIVSPIGSYYGAIPQWIEQTLSLLYPYDESSRSKVGFMVLILHSLHLLM
uniref:Uncharacterized protein n=1 Tax=Cacopsylla melanoneura TaxID=428564 RepID=A0A8D8LSP8_9HEMI